MIHLCLLRHRPVAKNTYNAWAQCRPSSGLHKHLSTHSSSTDNVAKVKLDFHHNNSLAILTLSNPLRRNALTYSMMEQLDTHVSTLERWTETGTVAELRNDTQSTNEQEEATTNNSQVLILTGSKGHFCSGLDLHDHASSSPLASGERMNRHMTCITNRIHSLRVPSIAAVDGNGIGGGAELTTCTDFVVLSFNARVEFVHVKRGASPGWGGGRRLVRRIGRGKALKLLLGECILGHEEGVRLNYADGVAMEGETALDAAMRLIAQPILELPCAKAVRAVKSVVSAADEDGDVIDSEGRTLLYDTNKALSAEREAFVSLWGGDSNLRQIKEAKEKLREKKERPS